MEDGDRRWRSSLKPFTGVRGRPEVDIGRRKGEPRVAGTGRYKGGKVKQSKCASASMIDYNGLYFSLQTVMFTVYLLIYS